MKIEGTKQELQEMFKPKSKNNLFKLPKFPKLNKKQRAEVFKIALICLIISIPILLAFLYYETSESYITISECNNAISQSVNNALALNQVNPYLALIYNFKTLISFLLIAIGLAWIFHGFGFRIIGNN